MISSRRSMPSCLSFPLLRPDHLWSPSSTTACSGYLLAYPVTGKRQSNSSNFTLSYGERPISHHTAASSRAVGYLLVDDVLGVRLWALKIHDVVVGDGP